VRQAPKRTVLCIDDNHAFPNDIMLDLQGKVIAHLDLQPTAAFRYRENPLPFVLCHTAIISPGLPTRNAGIFLGDDCGQNCGITLTQIVNKDVQAQSEARKGGPARCC